MRTVYGLVYVCLHLHFPTTPSDRHGFTHFVDEGSGAWRGSAPHQKTCHGNVVERGEATKMGASHTLLSTELLSILWSSVVSVVNQKSLMNVTPACNVK